MNFKGDVTETKSCVLLRAEDGSKAQVISSLVVYAEHLPALEPRSDSYSVYRKG